MEYGLIGEKLSHSFSQDIHTALCGYDYELLEIEDRELESFFKKRDFKGINVTIPYKTEVMKYLDFIDGAAKEIGAVNTVINRNGKLSGYNTDAFGLTCTVKKNGIELSDKKVAVLGGGGTSKTAEFVAFSLGARSVLKVSRTKKKGFITYEELKTEHTDCEVIINTTPVGMFPNTDDCPIDLSYFPNLQAVIDVIYNPLKTRLLLSAEKRAIKTASGLYMLVMQAYKSAELFSGENIDILKAEEIYERLKKEKQNIVLIGMPSCGKTTIGKIIAENLKMDFFDSDIIITKKTGKTPAKIIRSEGEEPFRKIESEVLYELSLKNHCVIATGGGAVTKEENITTLKQSGKIYYIDRPVCLLTATSDRPLSSTKSDIQSLYNKRKKLYETAADVRIENTSDELNAARTIERDFLK